MFNIITENILSPIPSLLHIQTPPYSTPSSSWIIQQIQLVLVKENVTMEAEHILNYMAT